MNLSTSLSGMLFLVVSTFPACAEDESAAASHDESDFLRFVRHADDHATLETSVATYVDENNRRVDLVGAVHVADTSYYETLNLLFGGYDAVLYELVADADTRPTPGQGGDSMVSVFQRAMKDTLDLDFQLDAIDYHAKNFVHADLDPATFVRLQEESGESLISLMLQSMMSEFSRTVENPEESTAQSLSWLLALFSKNRAFSLKFILGQQFEDMERLVAGFERNLQGEESVLLIKRNNACLKVLEDQLTEGKKRVAIFYGAAHLPDLEQRLIDEFGFAKTRETWLRAWNIQREQLEKEAPTTDE